MNYTMISNQFRRVGNIFWFCLCFLRSALCLQQIVKLQTPRERDAPWPWANQLSLLWNHPHQK